jgi:hypothetical protein
MAQLSFEFEVRKDVVLSDVDNQASRWFLSPTDETQLRIAGIKLGGGGPHQSKTMMLAELTTLISANGHHEPTESVVQRNLLGKPSLRARQAALYRLRQLYGLNDPAPICRALIVLWARDPTGRPMLALLCALARDPSLRDGAAAVLDAVPGTQVRWPAIAAAFEDRIPGRLGGRMAKSLAQNAAWTRPFSLPRHGYTDTMSWWGPLLSPEAHSFVAFKTLRICIVQNVL